LGENLYKVGQLVTCYYKTIPPTPQWDPFVEGRPGIIIGIRVSTGKPSGKETRYFYEVFLTTWEGKQIKKLVSEENIVLYEKLPDLGEEIDAFLMKYYKEHPLATD
jgi:hypothetical protein